MSIFDVAVIGAGASGTAAAIQAASTGASVLVLEADSKPRRKLLKTGNGRCNLTNASIDRDERALKNYRNAEFAKVVLMACDSTETRRRFEHMGLLAYEDIEGRVYPVTKKAKSVADVLSHRCEVLGVETLLETEVVLVEHKDSTWGCRTSDGRIFHSRSVVLACGCCELASELGVPVVSCRPVLGPLKTKAELAKRMSGVRSRCLATLLRSGEEVVQMSGEVLFRKYGISGIVVFDLSRYALPGDVVELDLMPAVSEYELQSMLERRIRELPVCPAASSAGVSRSENYRYTARTLLDGMLQPEVADAMLWHLGIDGDAPPSSLPAVELAHLLKHIEMEVTEGVMAEDAQVMRGGIAVEAMDPATMRVIAEGHGNSRSSSSDERPLAGIFACGEAVDVDGACGGYNLQWAWSSGFAAGEAAAMFALETSAAAIPTCASASPAEEAQL